jgi:DNA (cytosine-5)-methyltransferase 1
LKWGAGGTWFLEITKQLQLAGYWFRESSAQELDLYRLTSIPQSRSRLFMVAWSMDHFTTGRFAFPRAKTPPPKDPARYINFHGEQDDRYYLPRENRYFKMISSERSDTRTVKHIYQLRKYFVRQKEAGICPTLTANMGHGGHNVPFVWDRKGLRKLTEQECLKLQGFPARFTFPVEVSPKQRYAQIGNSVAPPVAKILAQAVKDKLLSEGLR